MRDAHTQTPCFRGAGDERFEHGVAITRVGAHLRRRVAIDERVSSGIGERESNVQIPPVFELLDRICVLGALHLLLHVAGEHLPRRRMKQRVHVPELTVDRGRLYACRRGDGSCGDGGAPLAREQVGGGAHDARALVHSLRHEYQR